eukprot:704601-Amorphochlora_amoeboformis.AAC.1
MLVAYSRARRRAAQSKEAGTFVPDGGSSDNKPATGKEKRTRATKGWSDIPLGYARTLSQISVKVR